MTSKEIKSFWRVTTASEIRTLASALNVKSRAIRTLKDLDNLAEYATSRACPFGKQNIFL